MLDIVDRPGCITRDAMRDLFEGAVKQTPAFAGNTPLDVLMVNGKARYMDPDTDTMWLGFAIGMRCAERVQRSAQVMDSDQVGAALEAGQAGDSTALDGAFAAITPTADNRHLWQNVEEKFERQPGHLFIGLDFMPVSESLPDDNSLVFMLLSPSEDEPMLLGYHENGFWFFADGMVVGSPYTVTHWSDMPEVGND